MGSKAAGVILPIAGGWIDLTKDMDGREINANIFLGDDSTARVNATYGVSGASCPNSISTTVKHMREAKLNDYITEQLKICDAKGYHMVVAGDINSYTQPNIDNMGGPTNLKKQLLCNNAYRIGLQGHV